MTDHKPCKICGTMMYKTTKMSAYNWLHKTTCSEPCRKAYRLKQSKEHIWYGHETKNLQPLLNRAWHV